MRQVYGLFFLLLFALNTGCQKDAQAGQAEIELIEELNQTTCGLVDPSNLVNGDQLPIVAGKLLSYAVSTADECAYMPPGKWVNLYGMVYYRYIERGSGDTKVSVSGLVKETAEAVASILTPEQLDKIIAIIPQQLAWENTARSNRDSIARELYQWKSGTAGDEALILSLSRENGTLLKNVIHQRTAVFAEIVNGLTTIQREGFCLSRTTENDQIDPEDLKSLKNQLNNEAEKTTLNLVLSKFFVWATGTERMNQLVDDGRPGVYFGFANLRIEDREGEEVSNGLRKEASDLIVATMTTAQHNQLNNLVSAQESHLSTYFTTRANLATALVGYLNTPSISLEEVLEICINSEVAEAQLAILQAKEMGQIIQSFDATQWQILNDFKAGN